MGSGTKNKKGYKMGSYLRTDREDIALRWGIKNGIKISPLAATSSPENSEWYIIIENKGSINKSPESYGPTDIWKKLYEFYLFYYDKHNEHIKQHTQHGSSILATDARSIEKRNEQIVESREHKASVRKNVKSRHATGSTAPDNQESLF
jgi:hypothetical protein